MEGRSLSEKRRDGYCGRPLVAHARLAFCCTSLEGRPQHPVLRKVWKVGSNRRAHQKISFHGRSSVSSAGTALLLSARAALAANCDCPSGNRSPTQCSEVCRYAEDHRVRYECATCTDAPLRGTYSLSLREWRQHCPVGGCCQGAKESQRVALSEEKDERSE